jgi:hypothetical protein
MPAATLMLLLEDPVNKIILDLPSEAPSLGFPEYADALADIVMNSDARFAIGIFGDWGAGKTTLMRAIGKRLPTVAAICVHFSAWRYERVGRLRSRPGSASAGGGRRRSGAQRRPAAQRPESNLSHYVLRRSA